YMAGELYTASLSEGIWSPLQKLEGINTVFNETHASLSPDGKWLYFTSDRKGGYGGLDIYRSALDQQGKWGKPVNLGPLINSPYNEESPFITPDGRKLFFSSQGHYNMGGYDIFFSQPDEDGRWLPPINAGYPLNTTDDDLFFVPIDTGNVAYQARFSETTATQDIIRIKVSAYGKPARYTLNGKINLVADSLFNPSDITVTFVERKAQDTLSAKPLNNDGTFRQKLPGGSYLLHFTDGVKLLLEKQFDIPEYFPHDNLVFNDSIAIIPPLITELDTFYVRDIRFAFDKSNLTPDQLQYLVQVVQILRDYPGLTIQVNGYADALGNEQYNMGLSHKRAAEVADYITNREIGEERITVKAFGEENPVASNRLPDGSDSPVGRSYNRRVTLMMFNVPEKLVVIGVKDVPGEYLQH
ncbi:MAG: OmpA family protein, partial [Bacteroidales bacterium]|nr:OmpA family protein [Bacteroidales bacterium]